MQAIRGLAPLPTPAVGGGDGAGQGVLTRKGARSRLCLGVAGLVIGAEARYSCSLGAAAPLARRVDGREDSSVACPLGCQHSHA